MARNRRIKSGSKSIRKVAKGGSAARPGDASTDRPTPEMAARVKFELGQVTTETGLPFGFAYRRKPLIETMALKGGLSPDEIGALRYYRTAFDRCERSPVKSCLNVSNSGRGARADITIMQSTPSMIDAKRRLRECESCLGPNLTTMRGLVLDDKSFSVMAMERFGSRHVSASGGRIKVTPKSGRHREIVRQEFIAGVRLLTSRIRHLVTTGRHGVTSGWLEELWVDPLPGGTAVIRRSSAAPAGRYRIWGEDVIVAQVMADLRSKHGDALEFTSATLAIEVLDRANDARLRRLETDELAA